MVFVELVFVVCLTSESGACREERHLFAEPATVMGCLVGAQPFMASWTEQNPGWAVSTWRCGVIDPRSAEI